MDIDTFEMDINVFALLILISMTPSFHCPTGTRKLGGASECAIDEPIIGGNMIFFIITINV